MNISEVKSTIVVKLSPIKNAIKSILAKNTELSGLQFLITRNLKEGIDIKSIASSSVFHTLSRALAGTVDSPVNGGVGQYRLFFDTESDETNYQESVACLKQSFSNLIILLNKLLKLHDALIPTYLKPQHHAMLELFKKNFKSEIESLKLDVQSPMSLERLLQTNLINHGRRHRGRAISNARYNTLMHSHGD
ncbi:unnamed protein product [Ambrosiozyma monospora]|uniref:Unnamed protein product n=1 Tax=Ambrosiozyma monospora TaxID=43982 RepID=A0ACB5UCH1_AMBMO|nr:unnamed protein product [Ambrosiozyma monospora]